MPIRRTRKVTAAPTEPSVEPISFSNPEQPETKGFSLASTRWLPMVGVAVIALAIGGVAYSAVKKAPGGSIAQAPVDASVIAGNLDPYDIPAVVAAVSRHLPVNTEEVPLVAVAKDSELLRQLHPVFYGKVENGDLLVIYTDKVILYSSSKDQVLAAMPLLNSAAPTNAAPAIESSRIQVRNGSGITGLAKTTVSKLNALKGNVTMQAVAGDAKSKEKYTKTILVVPSGVEQRLPQTVLYLQKTFAAELHRAITVEGEFSEDLLLILGTYLK